MCYSKNHYKYIKMGFKNMFKQFIKSRKGETEKGKQKEQTENKMIELNQNIPVSILSENYLYILLKRNC